MMLAAYISKISERLVRVIYFYKIDIIFLLRHEIMVQLIIKNRFIVRTKIAPSSSGITSVNHNISSRRIRTSIADEIDICALELLGIAVASHGDHASP